MLQYVINASKGPLSLHLTPVCDFDRRRGT